ncbi:uncharacterized protein LOC134655641 [Cydia amplana]|uniref:uncharacterized protein LOC134655641 n=1 Tax=Cydia amplana TaxID=1869771 RepID=UPI002FE5964F
MSMLFFLTILDGIKGPPLTKGSQFRATLHSAIELVLEIFLNSVTMHPLVYLMLLAGPCLARYRYEPRNLIERDDLQDKGEWVDCPVCETPSYSSLTSDEVCEMHNGRPAKLCLHGTYINKVCGSRRDCYRGPEEPCTEKLENDEFGWKCAPGSTCSSLTGKCIGLGNPYRNGQLHLINPYGRYPLRNRREI